MRTLYPDYPDDPNDEPEDFDMYEDRLIDLYRNWCENNGTEPTPDGYTIWREERYEDI